MFARMHIIAQAVAIVCASTSLAILHRHDRPEADFVVSASDYPALGHLDERVEAVLVAPEWLLTAAHTVDALGPFDRPHVAIRDRCYAVEKILVHPKWVGGWPNLYEVHDLALLKLTTPVQGVEPVALYTGSDEIGKIVTLVGRGKTGDGVIGPQGDKGDVLRRATNRIEAANATALLVNFDEPSDATELEGVSGPGDSGGPAFVDAEGRRWLVGISSAGTGPEDGCNGRYGTFDVYVRVSAFVDWVRHTLETDPKPHPRWTGREIQDRKSVPWPDTAAGRIARVFFQAYDTGTPEALTAFYAEFGDPSDRTPAERGQRAYDGLRQRFGALRAHALATAESGELRVLCATEESVWLSLGFSAKESGRLERLFLKMERDPQAAPRCESHESLSP